ncbi:hypothetical protein SAMN02983003_3153 [Devosia enhydra]|uniref:Uncharacterized protein n=1 Tax=Devosia enhydra TaxID=665118 RepID=A0A1K2I0R1_9HYPH|nr:hypothetical protein [Devosia enhydra]SFZ85981.1 hypothetical protein SAMN02983003_3153 [Devosia enhydra]
MSGLSAELTDRAEELATDLIAVVNGEPQDAVIVAVVALIGGLAVSIASDRPSAEDLVKALMKDCLEDIGDHYAVEADLQACQMN